MPRKRPKPSFYRNNPNYPPPPPPLPVPPPPGSSAITLYRPPAITPYKPPGALTKFVPPPVSRAAGTVGAVAAGSFRASAGASGIAKGLGIVGRRIPYVGLGFVAFDTFLLLCGTGILPLSICPRPDNPSPGGSAPDFSGGQCVCALYRITTTFIYDGSTLPGDQLVQGQGDIQAFGPIGGTRTIELSPNADGTTRTRIEIFCRGLNGETCTSVGVWRTAIDTVTNYRSHKISNRGRIDGGLDNCGEPQPQPQPRELPDTINNFHYHAGNINLNITVPAPRPPSPLPKKAPLSLSPPAPLPDIIFTSGGSDSDGAGDDLDINLDYYFRASPSINFGDLPDTFNNFPPAPQPRFNNPDPFPKQNPPAGAALSLNSPPEIPPPLPDKLPDDASEADKYQMRQNKEITDKLYRLNGEILEIQSTLEKQNKVLENLQKLLDFEVQGEQIITRCDDLDFVYSYKDKVLRAINKQLDHIKTIDQIIIDEICEVEKESVVASPDWWQVRLNGNTPQIALIFRVKGKRTYHKLTIPHPVNTNKLILPPIPSYEKGNWQGEIVCTDNSKFLCNCISKEEAERLIGIASTLINPIFLGNPIRAYLAERKGVAVSPGSLLATSALYFPNGQQQTKPEWRSTFTKFGI